MRHAQQTPGGELIEGAAARRDGATPNGAAVITYSAGDLTSCLDPARAGRLLRFYRAPNGGGSAGLWDRGGTLALVRDVDSRRHVLRIDPETHEYSPAYTVDVEAALDAYHRGCRRLEIWNERRECLVVDLGRLLRSAEVLNWEAGSARRERHGEQLRIPIPATPRVIEEGRPRRRSYAPPAPTLFDGELP